ncbi:hypothetical protein MW887_008581, partial [Aspergillus wentii]
RARTTCCSTRTDDQPRRSGIPNTSTRSRKARHALSNSSVERRGKTDNVPRLEEEEAIRRVKMRCIRGPLTDMGRLQEHSCCGGSQVLGTECTVQCTVREQCTMYTDPKLVTSQSCRPGRPRTWAI